MKPLLALALAATATLAGCALEPPHPPTPHGERGIPLRSTGIPAALAPNEGAAVVSTPIYQAMQDPTPAYGKQSN